MVTLNETPVQFASLFDDEYIRQIAYLLYKNLQDGHVCVHEENLLEEKMPDPLNVLPFSLERALASKYLTIDINERKPFVLFDHRFYLQRYFYYETTVYEKLKEFVCLDDCELENRVQLLKKERHSLNSLFSNDTSDFDWQKVAVISGVLNNFTIITGGPGTGKTTTVAKCLKLLFKIYPDLKIVLCAPTGKAAARMGESLKTAVGETAEIKQLNELVPLTIHRLLKTIPNTHQFRHNANNPLSYDVVIVDESSMIDVALFAKLFDAIAPTTRLILLGDKNQLSSVEAGSLFGDMCSGPLNCFSQERVKLLNELISATVGEETLLKTVSNQAHPLIDHAIELFFSHRFTGDGAIGKFSKAILNNNEVELRKFVAANDDSEVQILNKPTAAVFDDFLDGYREYIIENDIRKALKKLNNIRVLCAFRQSKFGLYFTNQRIESILQAKNLIKANGDFYENKPIIITSNDYNLGLFNGDVGLIRADNKGVLKAWFEQSDGNLMSVSTTYINNFEPVYAMTIHKSQGSEFNNVYVLLGESSDSALLSRELLYTAVTRAKQTVTVEASEEVILGICKRKIQRASGIATRLETNN